MEENHILNKMFSNLGEHDLAIVLQQVASRVLAIREKTPDIGFWVGTLLRIATILSESPILTSDEENLIRNPPMGVNGKMRAIQSLKSRTGMRLLACKDIVYAWIENNKASITLIDNEIQNRIE